MIRCLLGMLLAVAIGQTPACLGITQKPEEKPAVSPTAVSESEKKLADSINAFGFSMLPELAKEEGKNQFFSPASISTALALTWNGTAGDTASEVAKALRLGDLPKETANKDFAAVLAAVQQAEPKVEVNIANALWASKNGAFHPDFLRVAQESFQAAASQVDFAKPDAAEIINAWVKEKTRDKIDRIVAPEDLGDATDAVLTNAVYFKGIWKTQFDPKDTAPADFTLADGSKKSVPLMRQSSMQARFLHGPGFDAAALPYGSGRFNLYLFLPVANSSLKAFLPSLTAEKWSEWMGGFHEGRETVLIPRFKVEAERSLVKPLQSLGIRLLFNGGDLGPMGFPGDFVSEVKHKAVMEVNEEGTTAAAATGLVVTRSISRPFRVDRPFLAAIRDERTGVILFMGAVFEPMPLP